MSGMTPLALYEQLPGDTGLKGIEIALILSLTFNLVSFTTMAVTFCCLYREVCFLAMPEGQAPDKHRVVLPHQVW